MDAALDAEVIEDIKNQVFASRAIKLSDSDPIFCYFIGQQVVLARFTDPILQAMASIPDALEISLSKILFAVEEVERTSETLCAETKSTLKALAKCELESAHQRINESINHCVSNAVTDCLKSANAEVAALALQLKSLSNGSRDPKALWMNLVMACSVAVLICVFSTGLFLMYQATTKNVDAANYWHGQYKQQEAALSALPPALKSQLPPSLKPK